MYVGEGNVGEEEFHAYGTDSLCHDQSILDVIPRDHRVVFPWTYGWVSVKTHDGVPPMDPGKLGGSQGGVERTPVCLECLHCHLLYNTPLTGTIM